MKAKEALLEMHKTAAAHAVAMSKGHRSAEKCFKAMGDKFADAAAAHGAMADSCTKAASDHLQNCDALKTAIAQDLDKIIPDSISSVSRMDTPVEGFGITAIPRTGAPDPNLDKASRDRIAPQFRHLIGISDQE
jgi:hypothetical protein